MNTSSELVTLALEMADDLARLDVETYGSYLGDGWVDINTDDYLMERALRYIGLRGDDFGYGIEREGELFRFKKKKVTP